MPKYMYEIFIQENMILYCSSAQREWLAWQIWLMNEHLISVKSWAIVQVILVCKLYDR